MPKGRKPRLTEDMRVYFIVVEGKETRMQTDRLCADLVYAKLVKKYGRDRLTYGSFIMPYKDNPSWAAVERKILRLVAAGEFDKEEVLWTFTL